MDVLALKTILAALDREPVPQISVSGRVVHGAPPPPARPTAEIRRYEELLRDAKTETAAKYFVDRLGELRSKNDKHADLYGTPKKSK